MKKRPIIIAAAVAVLSVSVLLVSRNTVAYLMDTEAADNVIQIGNVSVELKEESFPKDLQTIEVGKIIPKNPQLKNNGTNDEYVFLKVSVPKENVTLLYEDTVENQHSEGQKIPNYSGENEIFKVIAENGQVSEIPDTNVPKKIVFSYHKEGTDPGWVYLGILSDGYTNFKDTSTVDSNKYNIYYFGYSKVLKKDDETVTLFDKVQLKSFIDREVKNGDGDKTVQVKVEAYAIQSDDLGITVSDKSSITDEELKKILKVIDNKQTAG